MDDIFIQPQYYFFEKSATKFEHKLKKINVDL